MAKQPEINFDGLPEELSELIKKYHADPASKNQTEATVRNDYINSIVELLGWDLTNKEGIAEFYREVIVEDTQEVEGATKKPDYAIRFKDKKLFYVEAKRPSKDLQCDSDAAFQIRRYGWSAGMEVCLLTSFNEFAVYDTTIKPQETDRAAIARIFYCKYGQLGTPYKDSAEGSHSNWDYICSLFSKEAVKKGILDRINKGDRKIGTQTVDEEFLREIEQWRESLAQNIAYNNTLDNNTLNEVVQKTIDRLLFLRICEDRGIEPKNTLKSVADTGRRIYSQLFEIFKKSDAKYNSGLFYFDKHIKEKGFSEMPDQVSGSVKISDKPLLTILKQLYYPSPYQFSVMPTDILGSVYERFLGKKICLTSTNRCEVVPRSEVIKAGGVYYTPQHIVEYIVLKTIGEQLKLKCLKTVKNYRIVDPACGSGSFLIAAYQLLLDWYLEQYIMDSAKQKSRVWKMQDGAYRLSVSERKRILTEHIYGVDIDRQAVEVTKLSLLLKTLEGVKEQEIQLGLMELIPERALPNLANNIKCGNSLIGTDIFSQPIPPHTEFIDRINPFDWSTEFKEIFQSGGFDAVIGNPPWISLSGKFRNDIHSDNETAYLMRKYSDANAWSRPAICDGSVMLGRCSVWTDCRAPRRSGQGSLSARSVMMAYRITWDTIVSTLCAISVAPRFSTRRHTSSTSDALISAVGFLPMMGKMFCVRRARVLVTWLGLLPLLQVVCHSRATASKEFAASSPLAFFMACFATPGSMPLASCSRAS